MTEAEQRAAVAAEARKWILTPYHHGADIRGAGVDCGMLIVRVFVDLGLTPPFDDVLPPTLAGWRRFLELAPLAGEKFTVLERAGIWWFGRGIPRNLLSAGRVEEEEAAAATSSSAPGSRAA